MDLQRLWTRAVRRAGLPIRFSEGFTPRPQLSFPVALGIGIESHDEVLEIELTEEVPTPAVRERLNAQLPVDVQVWDVHPFARADRLTVGSVEYEARTPLPADLERRVVALLGRSSVEVRRERGEESKTVNIRPFILEIRGETDRVRMKVRVTPSGSARPSEILQALQLDPDAPVLKLKTHFESTP